MSDSSTDTDEQKEQHRLGTINRWDPPEGDWAADHDWTRYRGPDPWPVPGGWVFKSPEEGGWWQYFGDMGVGHHSDDSILEELKDDDSVDDPYDALDDARSEYASITIETANPEEVSLRNPEDEKLEWELTVAGVQVFRRVEPDSSDLMAAVADALAAFHDGDLDDRVGEIVPETGEKPEDILEEEDLERRQDENESLDEFITDGGRIVHPSTGGELPERPDYDRDDVEAIDDALVELFEDGSEAGAEYYAAIAESELGSFRLGDHHRAVIDGGDSDE